MLIDFHAHILPGMDHGCEDVTMSLKQLKMAAESKIHLIIATSHFYPHVESVSDFLVRRTEAWNALKDAKKMEYPKIKLGAEVLICNKIDQMEGIHSLCIEHSNVLLIEMPFTRLWDRSLIDTLIRLREDKGFEVILAHGERYPENEMDKLLRAGFKVQLNVSSTARIFSSHFVKRCMDQNYVAALGSDIHGLHNTYKDFHKSMRRWGNKADQIMEKTRKLVEDN